MGHPRHFVFDNEGTNFEGKMRRVVDTMSKIVGLPLVQRTPTKFLLAPQPVISSTKATTAAAAVAMQLAEANALKGGALGEGGEVAAAAAAAAMNPPGSPGRRPRGDSLDSDAMAASLRKELAAVARESESADVQVFEVEKVYVLIGGKGSNSTTPPVLGGGVHKTSPTLQPVAERASSPKVSPTASPDLQDQGDNGGLDFGNGALPAKLEYSFIRRRTQDGFSVYGHTTVTRHPSGERVEVKRIMSRKEYEWMKGM